MASMGSPAMERSVLLYSRSHGPPRALPVFFGHAKVVGGDFGVMRGCRVTRPQRIKILRATGGKGSGEGEEDGEGPEEDAFQATIEKSKKVLEMQRDLLQQVVLLTHLYFIIVAFFLILDSILKQPQAILLPMNILATVVIALWQLVTEHLHIFDM